MSQLLYVVLVLVGFGAYWWYRSAGQGGRGVQNHLGLSAGEEIKTYVTGRHHLELGAADVGAAAVGMVRTGKTVTVTLTTSGALVLRTEGDAPIRPAKGALVVRKVRDGVDSLVGTQGAPEPADAFELSGAGIPTMTLVLARSSASLIDAWNRGA